MIRKFVVCVDGGTSEQQDKLTQFFKEEATVGYWHWFSDLWLVTDPYNNWSAGSLRDKIKEILADPEIMVIQIDGSNTWSGFGNTKMFKWFHDSWK